MSQGLFPALAAVALTVGPLHSLAPDHWIPVAAVGRARGWSGRRTARVGLLCGFGHVTVSVLLGVAGLLFGTELLASYGRRMESVAGLLLIGFGIAYAAWGLRHALAGRLHGHHHHHYDHVHAPERATVGSLFALYCADPCIAVIPLLFAAAPLDAAHTVALVVLYEASTILTMVALISLAHAGARAVRGRFLERFGDATAGGVIVAAGVLVALLGW